MKKFTKFALTAAMVLVAGASASAQNFKEDPRYGNSPEEREKNVAKLNFLQDAYNAKQWKEAAGYIRELMNDAPAASQAIYQYGATTYKNLAARATSIAQKKVYVDSVMLIYDRRVEYFGNNQATPAMQLKARDYLALNPMDRAGVRQFYKDAVDVSAAPSPGLVLEYFQQLVNDFKSVEITPEDLLGAYERLAPMMENASAEEKDGFTGLFATSGAADCNVLQELYTKELAAKPGDVEVLKKAYGLMSMAKCDSDFYVSVAEQLYKLEPTADIAINLARMFENRQQYDRAIPYLNEQIETTTDASAKADLYVRIAVSELGQKKYSAAAQAARQAISLNADSGYAHFCLANAYLGGAAQCGGFNGQTVAWLAYDEFSRAREAFTGDAAMLETVSSSMASCRASFPSTEDAFMHGLQNGASHTVSCGWVSGTTTVRTR